MEMKQVIQLVIVMFTCLLLTAVQSKDQGSELEELTGSQPQKRSADLVPDSPAFQEAIYTSDDDTDKRSSLFRFGKRGTLFRFGKRGSLFRFGKRGSLFRFGKRGSLFRFGKRDDNNADELEEVYPELYLSDSGDRGDLKRVVKSFHWGRETEE